ncbi:hypothetical protein [Trujillonella humicola]|uniref:hypothetical protein n=1 Tax=Trujillonella humicola TaxID=3383699 RepID=UPI0039063D9C
MTRNAAHRALAAPLPVAAAALLAMTGCGADPAPHGAAAGTSGTAVESPVQQSTAPGPEDEDGSALPPGTGGDEATCRGVLSLGAVLPLYALGEQEADPDELVELLDLIAAEGSWYDAETPEVHNAAVDVQTAAEEASDAIAGGGDVVEALGPVVDALAPLGEACTAAGVPLG